MYGIIPDDIKKQFDMREVIARVVDGSMFQLLPDGMIPPDGISRAVVFLASDESESITGAALPVDAGWTTF